MWVYQQQHESRFLEAPLVRQADGELNYNGLLFTLQITLLRSGSEWPQDPTQDQA